jgi:Protein of unknown function (DUF3048) N-terminal domain/Protein of unknown function (DUF3048) C-terminal domain
MNRLSAPLSRRFAEVKRNTMVAGSALAALLLTSGCGGAVAAKVAPTLSPTRPPIARSYRWPLTGRVAPSAPTQPALSVKIDNAPSARPQSGLDSADLVFECLVEGGMSRFLAVYQSQRAAVLGPIRSARPVDGALLLALHGGIFAYSGAAAGEIAPARAYSTAVLLSNDADPSPFERVTFRYPPENVYSSTDKLRAAAARRSAHPGLPGPLFTYGPVQPGSRAARQLSVVVGGAASASWAYDGATYLRSENGSPHLLANGHQVRATNIVVLRVQVTHTGMIDAAGNEDPFVLAYGSGAAQVFRNGVVEDGRWSRPTISSPYQFISTRGGALTLAPGPTWIELVPPAGSVAPA